MRIVPIDQVQAKFQSLIGRLKTEMTRSQGFSLHMFQSLIGRLKTPSAEGLLEAVPDSFQSLIGRLKTAFRISSRQIGESVSIPHR